jgi:hypothetical protein
MVAFWNRSYGLTVKGKVYLAERASGEVDYSSKAKGTRIAEPRFLDGEKLVETRMALLKPIRQPDGKTANPMVDDPADYVVPPETAAAKSRVPVPKFSRREKLVELAVNSRSGYFKRAAVNYVWSQLFGRGLVEPIDQMHEGNPASHPALLAFLADDFAEHGFDLRYLIGCIAKSQTYQRKSNYPGDKAISAETSYARASIRPLSAHQLALSLVIAAGYGSELDISASPTDSANARAKLENQHAATLSQLVGEVGGASTPFQPGVREALFQANSAAFAQFIAQGNLATRLAAMTDERRMAAEAFWSVLSRLPTEEETARLSSYLQARSENRSAACQQMVWSLLTSAEFRFNH